MKNLIAALLLSTISVSAFASHSVSEVEGLADLGLKQFNCKIDVINAKKSKNGVGELLSLFKFVVASDATAAKAAAINKVDLYGPFEGKLFFTLAVEDDKYEQYEIKGIRCY